MSLPKNKKVPTSYALTNEAKRLLKQLADHYGISQSAALEVIIREKAEWVQSAQADKQRR